MKRGHAVVNLVGRHRERQEVVDRLRERRIVTIIGPGGIGKTALARSVSDLAGGDYELGTRYIDLTRVEVPEDVAGAIAVHLGFRSFESLLGSPSEQPALVVVDNCEHVIDAAAEAIAELLAACNSPTVLATSRSPLDLPDESIVVLGPLTVPRDHDDDMESEAVQLFVERARDAGTEIDRAEIATVAALCRHLDGLPLAIELAAARTRTLRPAEILDRLTDGVEVLERQRFRGDERHRSLSTTVDWSYRLLPADVVPMFERLSLFAGPFTAEIAHAVGRDAGLPTGRARSALDVLVDASLVIAEPAADHTRFRLLQTIRAFALERLRESGTLDDAMDRLAEHVLGEAAALLSAGGRRWDETSLSHLLSLYETIASTLRWCLDRDDDPGRCLMLCSVLWGVVHQGHTDEVAALCEATLERWPDLSVPFAADAAATAATARCLLGDPEGAIELTELALPHSATSRTAPVTLRRAAAYSARALGDRARALTGFTELSGLARDHELLALALEADVTRAQLLADGGEMEEAIALARTAEAEAGAAGSTINEVWARSVRAHLELRADPGRRMQGVLEALVDARAADYPAAISLGLRSVAWAATRAGDAAAAATALLELLDDIAARSGVADLRGTLFTAAELLHRTGDPDWAPVASTAEALPLVGLTGAPSDELVVLPDHTGVAPLGRRGGVLLARKALHRVRATVGEADPPPGDAGPGAAVVTGRFVDRGDFWELGYGERVAHVKGSKGLSDLAALLAAGGREVHCLDLMGAGSEEGPAGETLDQHARREYEDRIRDLQADVELAERDNDFVRAERAQTELDALVEHLTAALGLGRQARRAGGSAERARSAVTQRIRQTIRRLRDEHPELARHLETSISTGTYCSYRPERPVSWDL